MDRVTQKAFEAAVSKMAPEANVPKVDHLRQPADRPRKSETVDPIMAGFSIHWDEFLRLTPERIWRLHLTGIIEEHLLRVKAKGRVKFFRFQYPPSSHNVRSLVYDADGVFAVLTLRHRIHKTHKDKGTEVVEFIFRMEVGDFDKKFD
jgi:hypothetical protein